MSENFGSLQYSVIHMVPRQVFRAFGCSVAGKFNFLYYYFFLFFFSNMAAL